MKKKTTTLLLTITLFIAFTAAADTEFFDLEENQYFDTEEGELTTEVETSTASGDEETLNSVTVTITDENTGEETLTENIDEETISESVEFTFNDFSELNDGDSWTVEAEADWEHTTANEIINIETSLEGQTTLNNPTSTGDTYGDDLIVEWGSSNYDNIINSINTEITITDGQETITESTTADLETSENKQRQTTLQYEDYNILDKDSQWDITIEDDWQVLESDIETEQINHDMDGNVGTLETDIQEVTGSYGDSINVEWITEGYTNSDNTLQTQITLTDGAESETVTVDRNPVAEQETTNEEIEYFEYRDLEPGSIDITVEDQWDVYSHTSSTENDFQLEEGVQIDITEPDNLSGNLAISENDPVVYFEAELTNEREQSEFEIQIDIDGEQSAWGSTTIEETIQEDDTETITVEELEINNPTDGEDFDLTATAEHINSGTETQDTVTHEIILEDDSPEIEITNIDEEIDPDEELSVTWESTNNHENDRTLQNTEYLITGAATTSGTLNSNSETLTNEETTENTETIDTTDLNPGEYTLTIEDNWEHTTESTQTSFEIEGTQESTDIDLSTHIDSLEKEDSETLQITVESENNGEETQELQERQFEAFEDISPVLSEDRDVNENIEPGGSETTTYDLDVNLQETTYTVQVTDNWDATNTQSSDTIEIENIDDDENGDNGDDENGDDGDNGDDSDSDDETDEDIEELVEDMIDDEDESSDTDVSCPDGHLWDPENNVCVQLEDDTETQDDDETNETQDADDSETTENDTETGQEGARVTEAQQENLLPDTYNAALIPTLLLAFITIQILWWKN